MDQLTTRLLGLTVWGTPSIKLKREVNDIQGTEDTGDLIFQDTDTTLKVFMPINIPNQPMSTYRLSEAFIKHCGITDTRYQKLVMPILTISIAEIEKLLEMYNLDGPRNNDSKGRLPESLFSNLGEDIQLSPVAELPDFGDFASRASFAAARESLPRSGPSSSGPASSLRARIPTLDQSVATVREAAASHAAGARLVLFSSETPHIGRSVPSKGDTGSEIYEDSGFGGSIMSRTPTRGSESSTEDSQDMSSKGAFDFDTLRSALPEVSARVAPARRLLVGERSSVSHTSGRASHGRNDEFEEESSLQGLHQKHIGLLGEAFVRVFLAQNIEVYHKLTFHRLMNIFPRDCQIGVNLTGLAKAESTQAAPLLPKWSEILQTSHILIQRER
jgi:hypothetical protein